MMEKHICLLIKGRVQGVGFRYHTLKTANDLGIKGFVKNKYDGSVYIEASGETNKVDQFVDWCFKGPEWAHVEDVQITENKAQNLSAFSVK